MKHLKIIICLITFASCTSVHFDSAMPNDQKQLDKFNAGLIGRYYCSDSILGKSTDEPFYNDRYFSHTYLSGDSIDLFSADLIISEKYVHYTLETSSCYKISKSDTLRLVKKHKKTTRSIEGEYLVFKEKMTDTVINILGNDRLYCFDGKFYLNHFVEKKNWDVCQFEQTGDSTYSFNMTNDRDQALLMDTTKARGFIFPVAHLSNKKFKDFVANGGFRNRFGFVKYAQ